MSGHSTEQVGETIAPHYPCTITLDIFVTDGANVGKQQYMLPHGRHPSEAVIRAALAETLKRVREQLGLQWNLCDRHQFVGRIVEDTFGKRMDIPGPKDFKASLTPGDITGTTDIENT